jgi:hypothetical protein
LNIVAGNGYFAKKQKEYAQSKIEMTKTMSSSEIHDWDLDSIVERDIRVADEILDILKQWDNEYKNISVHHPQTQQPTAEELAKIEEFKQKGWI